MFSMALDIFANISLVRYSHKTILSLLFHFMFPLKLNFNAVVQLKFE